MLLTFEIKYKAIEHALLTEICLNLEIANYVFANTVLPINPFKGINLAHKKTAAVKRAAVLKAILKGLNSGRKLRLKNSLNPAGLYCS